MHNASGEEVKIYEKNCFIGFGKSVSEITLIFQLKNRALRHYHYHKSLEGKHRLGGGCEDGKTVTGVIVNLRLNTWQRISQKAFRITNKVPESL